ncbi:MAG: hypothetical protein CME71_00695 [Halobacteriovorax sp.]|nr:hypothetical protein [Halobacteriovorax sp.]|tara:strand:- start:198 stop:815 length:618 start_codon:yes stop_codon:yes gene_type:complete
MSKKSPFQQIDEALFKGVDQLKSQTPFVKFQETVAKLGDQEQKIINLSISYLLLFIPIILVLSVWLMNSSMRSTIEEKRQILSEIEKFNNRRSESDSKGRELIVLTPIAAQSELQTKITQILSRARIPGNSVNVRSFNEGSSAGELKEFNAELSFDKLSTAQFTELVKQLEERERLKISGLLIENRIDQSILKGKLNLAFLTQQK